MALDPIEAEMAEGADVLYREKTISRGVAAACAGLGLFATVATVGATQTGEIGASGAIIGVVIALALVLFGIAASVTRIVVRRDEIRLVLGGRRRRISVPAITSAELQSFRGGPPVAVTVKWTEDGDEEALVLPSTNPEALLAAVRGATSRARIASATEGAGADRQDDQGVEEADAEDARAQVR